jgi:hypothetical protein
VRVEAKHVPTGEVAHTCTAYLTMVSLGEDGEPVLLPALEPQTPEDERRDRDANTAARSGSRRPAHCAESALTPDAAKSAAYRPRGSRPRSSHRRRRPFALGRRG